MQDIVANESGSRECQEKLHQGAGTAYPKEEIVRRAAVESEIVRLKCKLVGSFDSLAVEVHRAAGPRRGWFASVSVTTWPSIREMTFAGGANS